MKKIKPLLLFLLLFFFVISSACQSGKILKKQSIPDPLHKTLLITNDYGDIRQCSTYSQLDKITDIMISAHPDIAAFDLASPNVCYYKSSIEMYCSGSNMDKLYEKGKGSEPFEVIVKKFRKAHIKILAGIRMNDHHGSLELWTPWDKAHINWSLGKDTGDRSWRTVGDLRQMDYAIEGVREHRLSIIKEILSKFDVDGLQLDFGRTAPFLSEPKKENAKYLTQYIRDVHAALDNAGKAKGMEMTLGMILPWDLNFCENEGIEIRKWIEEGLVSYVSPGEWYYADWNIPIEGWTAITKNTTCRLYPMTCGNVSPYQLPFEMGQQTLLTDNRVLDQPKISAIAENFYGQGAEGFMFYNFYVSGTEQDGSFAKYYPNLKNWIDSSKISSLPRHYFYVHRLKYLPTEHYSFGMPKGYAPDEEQPFHRQPLKNPGDEISVSFLCYDRLIESTARFRFKIKDISEKDRIEVKMNGIVIDPDTLKISIMPVYNVGIWVKSMSASQLNKGLNEVTVKLIKIDQSRKEIPEVGEFEIIAEPVIK